MVKICCFNCAYCEYVRKEDMYICEYDWPPSIIHEPMKENCCCFKEENDDDFLD